MLIGQGKKLELWSESGWNQELDTGDDDESMPEEMLSLSL
jgi:MraZ protein